MNDFTVTPNGNQLKKGRVGGTQQFTSNGPTKWSLAPNGTGKGTIDANGLYKNGAAGFDTVTATPENGGKPVTFTVASQKELEYPMSTVNSTYGNGVNTSTNYNPKGTTGTFNNPPQVHDNKVTPSGKTPNTTNVVNGTKNPVS